MAQGSRSGRPRRRGTGGASRGGGAGGGGRARSPGSRGGARAAAGARPTEPPPVSPMQPGFAPECMMCPFGLLLFAVRQSRPEAMEHLLKAGQELTLALKAVVDQAADRWQQAETLQRIPVR